MRRGFSLVEMMIALSLTAVAITIMSEGVRRAIDFEQRLTEVRQQRESQTATLQAVKARLERLVPAQRTAGSGDGDGSEILFEGTAEGLVFLAADPGYPSTAGLYEYRFLLSGEAATESGAEPAGTSLTIYRRGLVDTAGFNTDRGNALQSWSIALPVPMAFRYAGQDGQARDSWQGQSSFPSIIMIIDRETERVGMTVAVPRNRPADEDVTQ